MNLSKQIKYWAKLICEETEEIQNSVVKYRRTAKEMGRQEPLNGGFVQGAKRISKDKFYMNKQMKSQSDIIYAIFQIVMLYCGNYDVPEGFDASELLYDQWEIDLGKYAGMLLGKNIDIIEMRNGWSSNNTNELKELCVDYFKQPRDKKDSSKIRKHLEYMIKKTTSRLNQVSD